MKVHNILTRSVVVGGLAAVIGGCSAELGSLGNIDSDKLENEISADITQALPGVAVEVQCPSDVPLIAENNFTCDATVAGQTLTFNMTQTDDDGNIDSQPQQSILVMDKISDQVTPQLTQQVGGEWQVNCNPPGAQDGVLIAPPGATFECSFSGTGEDGRQIVDQPMQITVDDTAGNVSWRA